MKRITIILSVLAVLAAGCDRKKEQTKPETPEVSTEKLSGITYQLNVYSFADSDSSRRMQPKTP